MLLLFRLRISVLNRKITVEPMGLVRISLFLWEPIKTLLFIQKSHFFRACFFPFESRQGETDEPYRTFFKKKYYINKKLLHKIHRHKNLDINNTNSVHYI